jgi:hypothetical protein
MAHTPFSIILGSKTTMKSIERLAVASTLKYSKVSIRYDKKSVSSRC